MKAEIESQEMRLSRPLQWAALACFALILAAPGLTLLIPSLRPSAPGEAGASADSRFKSFPLFERWRRRDQTAVTRFLGIGNLRVMVGREGWLYYRPDLDATSGKGPMHGEPASVAREKAKAAWRAPIPVIADFAEQLRGRGIRLLFVPVPVKPMIAREGVGLEPASGAPDLWRSTFAELERTGVEVVDLFPVLLDREQGGGAFLKQDTHWTPGAMVEAAGRVADRIGAAAHPAGELREVSGKSQGDLVGMLGMDGASAVFGPESVLLKRVDPARTDRRDVLLLGDSFANIYEDPALGFGEAAGFPSHLSRSLGGRIQTIAINGGGATRVREVFARLPAPRFAEVRTVVWLISSRDLLLPELPARRAGIEWRALTLPEPAESATAPAAAIEITVTLRERSAVEDPRETPYAAAIFSTLCEDENGTERLVFFWAFRDRRLERAAEFAPGERIRMRLVPLDAVSEAARVTRLDDLFRPDLVPWFAEHYEAAGN